MVEPDRRMGFGFKASPVVGYQTLAVVVNSLPKSQKRQDHQDDNDQTDNINNAVHEIASV